MRAVIDPVELLRDLIRFDTTNPPGNEEACVAFVETLLREHGIESERYEKAPGRPEPDRAPRGLERRRAAHALRARRRRDDRRPAVDARRRSARELVDGYVWGRGALDMKSGVAMCVAAFVAAHEAGSPNAAHPRDPERRGERRRRRRALSRRRARRTRSAARSTRSASSAARRSGSRASRSIRSRSPRSRCAGCARPCAAPAATARSASRAARCASSATCCARSTASSRRSTSSRSCANGSRRWPTQLPRTQAVRAAPCCSTRGPPTSRRARSGRAAAQLEPRHPQHGQPDDRARRRQDQRHPERDRAAARRPDPARPDARRPDPRAARPRRRTTSSSRSCATMPARRIPTFRFYEPLADRSFASSHPGSVPVPMLQAGVTDARFLSRAGVQTYGYLPLQAAGGLRAAGRSSTTPTSACPRTRSRSASRRSRRRSPATRA